MNAQRLHRLKKVQGKKKRDAQESDRLKKLIADEAASVEALEDPSEPAGGGDLLSSKDEDVIF